MSTAIAMRYDLKEVRTQMKFDSKNPKTVAATFFKELRASGFTTNQVIGIATELIDLVTSDLKEADKPMPVAAEAASDVHAQL